MTTIAAFVRTTDLERRLSAGEPITPEEGAWLARVAKHVRAAADALQDPSAPTDREALANYSTGVLLETLRVMDDAPEAGAA